MPESIHGVGQSTGGVLDAAAVDVLGVLLRRTESLTIERLARGLELPEDAARRAIELLADSGCRLERHPTAGVRLLEASLACWADYIEQRHAGRLGRRLLVYSRTRSTQDLARGLIGAAASPSGWVGTVVVSDAQEAGRGRSGRSWLAEPALALLLTAVVERLDATSDRLSLATCCAVAEAAEAVGGPPASIRWPNDVMIGDGKLAGVLIDVAGPAALIGIGINVGGCPSPEAIGSEPGPTRRAACLADHGVTADRLLVLDRLLDRLDDALTAADDRSLREAWSCRSSLLGRRVELDAAGDRVIGRVMDIDPAAGLMVQPDRGGPLVVAAHTTGLIRVW